jgi:hypothetical protein
VEGFAIVLLGSTFSYSWIKYSPSSSMIGRLSLAAKHSDHPSKGLLAGPLALGYRVVHPEQHFFGSRLASGVGIKRSFLLPKMSRLSSFTSS